MYAIIERYQKGLHKIKKITQFSAKYKSKVRHKKNYKVKNAIIVKQ